MSEPVTKGGVDRGYKLCQCGECGIVEECTPRRDFYTTKDPLGTLLCESCFHNYFWQQKSPNVPISHAVKETL